MMYNLMRLTGLSLLALLLPSTFAIAQDAEGDTTGTAKIILETRDPRPEPPPLYTAAVASNVKITPKSVMQRTDVRVKVVRGEAQQIELELLGDANITSLEGDNVQAWSIRREGSRQFLVVTLGKKVKAAAFSIGLDNDIELPSTVEITNFAAGKAIGLTSTTAIAIDQVVSATVVEAEGVSLTKSESKRLEFQSVTGGKITLALSKSGAAAPILQLSQTMLGGRLHASGESIDFTFEAQVEATEPTTFFLLSGNVAIAELPKQTGMRTKLRMNNGQPHFEVVVAEPGTYDLKLNFVAKVTQDGEGWNTTQFKLATGVIVPLSLAAFEQDVEFVRRDGWVVPVQDGDSWKGFLPASGQTHFAFRSARKTGEGKLFFETTSQAETRVSAGLLKQQHEIAYRVLQGELAELRIEVRGSGEILSVAGTGVVGWSIESGDGDAEIPDEEDADAEISDTEETNDDAEGVAAGGRQVRQLIVTLSQPITKDAKISVQTQEAIGAFPVRVETLTLHPVGGVRHSGVLRVSNIGAVRIEPASTSGLTQLSPEQYPGAKLQARQVFAYRHPTTDHALTLAADQIQPSVTVQQQTVYALSETDRTITADIELDISEAPIREWSVVLPADYAVVSVAGANVGDYLVSQAEGDSQRLKVIFGSDVAGRQLISLTLEQNIAVEEGGWKLPPLEFPDAETVSGNIAVAAAAGYRIAVANTDLLVEKPLSYFPKQITGLQQAFRIRQSGWTATMDVEVLQRSIQADVFHLYSLSQGVAYGSSLVNYFITGAPVSELTIRVPESLGNVVIDGQDIRTWRRDGEDIIVSLHQAVMGPYTLLITFEEEPAGGAGLIQAARISPQGVAGERGYVQVVSPMQVSVETLAISEELLVLDPLELPAEFRLLSTAPALGTWQYTQRPFTLDLKVGWFEPGTTVGQVVEFAEANSRVSKDGELVTDVVYYVKSRGQQTLRLTLPAEPARLWAASVDGQPVTARQAGKETLIPLPGGVDPNAPVEVALRLGKPAVDGETPSLVLPVVSVPILKTQWKVAGDEQQTLFARSGSIEPAVPPNRPTGLAWLSRKGLPALAVVTILLVAGVLLRWTNWWLYVSPLAFTAAAIVAGVSSVAAFKDVGTTPPMELSVPALAAGETISLEVESIPAWQAGLSWWGVAAAGVGLLLCILSLLRRFEANYRPLRFLGVLSLAGGVLLQADSAGVFFAIAAVAIAVFLALPALWWMLIDGVVRVWVKIMVFCARFNVRWQNKRSRIADRKAAGKRPTGDDQSESGPGVATNTIVFWVAMSLATGGVLATQSVAAEQYEVADSIVQSWQLDSREARLQSKAQLVVTGIPGDQFVILGEPAILTSFDGDRLRLTKTAINGKAAYVVTIPMDQVELDDKGATENTDEDEVGEKLAESESDETEASPTSEEPTTYSATFEYLLEGLQIQSQGVPILTGAAAIERLEIDFDKTDWELSSPQAVRVEQQDGKWSVLLGGTGGTLRFAPKNRDVRSEETKFFVEGRNLFVPGPGVVDGYHWLSVRPSQGEVTELAIQIPDGLTVSSVDGPVASWRFDADKAELSLAISPAASKPFGVVVRTQRGLDALPATLQLQPLQVKDASGEVGLLAVAFGGSAQPETAESDSLSAVSLTDFPASLLPEPKPTIYRVYRYGRDGGSLTLKVAPVEPEVRVASKQVLSLGDERVVLGINFVADITRAGLFQLSFPLPDGLEVESLTGDALNHWSELSDSDQRLIVLHLGGKTIGAQQFALTLSGPAPDGQTEWKVPRFTLREAKRQTGELAIRPTTGIRLRTTARQNASEMDPRQMGGGAQGALAYRLLQQDWEISLGIEQLEPWVTGGVLHDVTIREGQTRSKLLADFSVQNASIRSLRIALPAMSEDEANTLRATGEIVSDFIRVDDDNNVWEVTFKRRVVGRFQFQIEFERRGNQTGKTESLLPFGFPDARQLAYYFAVRSAGRLELQAGDLGQGWQEADWNSIPQPLKDAGDRNAPAIALRAIAPANPLQINSIRHSLADSLKLRVASGTLTTVLSPTGDQLTSVDVTMEVIQRSSLSVELPDGGQMFSIFVNGESVHSIREVGKSNVWKFYILPGLDDRTASVRLVYSVKGSNLADLKLTGPVLNVPLENIRWKVLAPKGFELAGNDGNLELVEKKVERLYDKTSYLSKTTGKRKSQEESAVELLEQANEFLQAGEQTKARWALSNVANSYALDAASNEDARVQLENLQTQQAIVGLNTRRQRLFMDNSLEGQMPIANEQMMQAAATNRILLQNELNFRPQEVSQFLQGNSSEDNAVLQRIAGRLVQHQRTTEPAPQAIVISLPEEGTVYEFTRTVQVADSAPLELDLSITSKYQTEPWQAALTLIGVLILAASVGLIGYQRFGGIGA